MRVAARLTPRGRSLIGQQIALWPAEVGERRSPLNPSGKLDWWAVVPEEVRWYQAYLCGTKSTLFCLHLLVKRQEYYSFWAILFFDVFVSLCIVRNFHFAFGVACSCSIFLNVMLLMPCSVCSREGDGGWEIHIVYPLSLSGPQVTRTWYVFFTICGRSDQIDVHYNRYTCHTLCHYGLMKWWFSETLHRCSWIHGRASFVVWSSAWMITYSIWRMLS